MNTHHTGFYCTLSGEFKLRLDSHADTKEENRKST